VTVTEVLKMDDEDEFVQLMLAEQQGDEFEDERSMNS
jgi:hypothetical protein